MSARDAEHAAVKRARIAERRVELLEESLAEAIQVIEWCAANDRTPAYDYGEARRDGQVPPAGKTFNTPREFARYWPEKLREALQPPRRLMTEDETYVYLKTGRRDPDVYLPNEDNWRRAVARLVDEGVLNASHLPDHEVYPS